VAAEGINDNSSTSRACFEEILIVGYIIVVEADYRSRRGCWWSGFVPIYHGGWSSPGGTEIVEHHF
jgi:hypothetical protein